MGIRLDLISDANAQKFERRRGNHHFCATLRWLTIGFLMKILTYSPLYSSLSFNDVATLIIA